MASSRSIETELPPHDDKKAVSWVDLMRLEKISDDTFRSTCRAFDPAGLGDTGGRPKQAYGGHVYAQAVIAASKTLPKVHSKSGATFNSSPGHEHDVEKNQPGKPSEHSDQFVCHSVTGYFTLAASSELPFVYKVIRVRDGKGFCVRTVQVTQVEMDGICFTCTASFKRYEPSQIEYQEDIDLSQRYAQVLTESHPSKYADTPATEGPWSANYRGPPFPGLVTKKVEMGVYNASRSPLERRQLNFYTAVGDMPLFREEPNVHVAAHLYASDRNSLFGVSRHMGVAENYSRTASLTHTVVLHSTGQMLDLSAGKWFTQESWTDRFGDGRGVHHSRLWDERSRHLATTLQDGLIRLRFEDDAELQRKRDAVTVKSKNSKL